MVLFAYQPRSWVMVILPNSTIHRNLYWVSLVDLGPTCFVGIRKFFVEIESIYDLVFGW